MLVLLKDVTLRKTVRFVNEICDMKFAILGI
jgi:hypothetical protein